MCKNCTGIDSVYSAPNDDDACGIIDCSGWYLQTGTEGPADTENCYNKQDMTADRCEEMSDCYDANTEDCSAQGNDAVQYSCGPCKYIAAGDCTGTTLGSCEKYAERISCGANMECNDNGECCTYSWQTSSWSGCSVSCGGGTQTRSYWCERSDAQNMGTSCGIYPGCECGSIPATSQSCNMQSCITPVPEYDYGDNCHNGCIAYGMSCSNGYRTWFEECNGRQPTTRCYNGMCCYNNDGASVGCSYALRSPQDHHLTCWCT